MCGIWLRICFVVMGWCFICIAVRKSVGLDFRDHESLGVLGTRRERSAPRCERLHQARKRQQTTSRAISIPQFQHCLLIPHTLQNTIISTYSLFSHSFHICDRSQDTVAGQPCSRSRPTSTHYLTFMRLSENHHALLKRPRAIYRHRLLL